MTQIPFGARQFGGGGGVMVTTDPSTPLVCKDRKTIFTPEMMFAEFTPVEWQLCEVF